MNILRSAAHYQKTVQRKLFGREIKDGDLSAEIVLNDIREIDVVAERIHKVRLRTTKLLWPLRKGKRSWPLLLLRFFLPYIHIRTRRILTMNDQVFVSIAVSLVLAFVAFYRHRITKQLSRIFQVAVLQKASKDDDFAKTETTGAKAEKIEDSTPPVEPPAAKGEGMYHRLRGHGKAEQDSHV
ncbi:unnamed protein product [Clonostachys rhizophaga]|uniref:Uncharacterized protein n=1 Tax=Clonostachys rhizophaga TaxID=160324 RepID=A0A9N9VV91_9HYPO|nr:unnamed protein product [Clonostachys rhizophaga]